MKTKVLSTLVLVSSLIACKKGDVGPEGPQGTPGSSVVKYSSWMEVKDASWIQADIQEYSTSYWAYGNNGSWVTKSGTDTTIQYKAEIPTPLITQGVLDSGIVAYYIKDSSGLNGGSVRSFDLNYAYNDLYNVGTTNRTKEEMEEGGLSNFWIHTNSDTLPRQKLTLYTEWQGGSRFYDPSSVYDYPYLAIKQKYTELKPKTRFYIRYVIIPGGTAIGVRRALPVNVNNYEEVKAYYKIAD